MGLMILWCLLFTAFGEGPPADVSGRVLERGTGNPIPNTALIIDGETKTSTDEGGFFTVQVPQGTETIEVTLHSFTHQPQTEILAIPSKKTIRIFLSPTPAPLEIVVEAFRPTAHFSRHVLDAETTLETPGNNEDAVRLVQSLPSVTVQREYGPSAGDLSIRGSSPGDNRYFVDGIEVPYLYHFNQYASVFSSSQLSSLELFSSTFGARYGDAIGAVVEARTNRTPPTSIGGSVMVNMIMASADFKAPLKKGWWLSASARRSYQDLVQQGTAQYQVWPNFEDWSIRAEHGTEDQGTGIFLLGAGDRYARAIGELDLADPVESLQVPSLDYAEGFQMLGANHRWRGTHIRGEVVSALNHYQRQGTLSSLGNEALRTIQWSARMDLQDPKGGPLGWAAGLDWRGEWTDLEVSPAETLGVLVMNEVPALSRGAEVNDHIWRLRGGAYGQMRISAGKLRILPGLRLSLDQQGPKVFIDPRLALRYRIASQTELKLAGGRYTQHPESELLFEGTGNPNYPSTQSWQVGGGIEQTVAKRMEFVLEGYKKWISSPLVHVPNGPPRVGESGDAWGVEFVTRYRLREVIFLWGWVGYSRSTVQLDGAEIPTNGDQAFSAGAVCAWDFLPTWNLGIRYRFGSGLPYTGVEGGLYNSTEDTWVPYTSGLNNSRMPPFHKLDIRISKTWIFNQWSLMTALDLWFVPPSSAQLYPAWSFDFEKEGWVTGPVLLPLLSLRASF